MWPDLHKRHRMAGFNSRQLHKRRAAEMRPFFVVQWSETTKECHSGGGHGMS
ncbi:hypothetical protein M2272_005830 [Mycobacterium frederiksbergense]|uniref:Uncharacterized protein n=1 Tax=Mycolicibacterium frederiksbergense TaxID=117567 RepID=A0ABT6L882_9MYCO|nr:hypothetical protein [Mycolicibacterium frederiksbergense]